MMRASLNPWAVVDEHRRRAEKLGRELAECAAELIDSDGVAWIARLRSGGVGGGKTVRGRTPAELIAAVKAARGLRL